jgi:gas vesicle protein
MMNNNQGSIPIVGAFVLGSVMGALAGMLAGVLLAPKSGAETQADIRKRMTDFRDQADEAFSRSREQLESTITGTGGRLAETARSKIAEQMENAASTINQQARNIRPDSKTAAG